MQTVSVMVDDEIKAVADAAAGLISNIKGGKTLMEDLSAAMAILIPAVQSLANIGADMKKPENQAYVALTILKAIEG